VPPVPTARPRSTPCTIDVGFIRAAAHAAHVDPFVEDESLADELGVGCAAAGG
jgi:hypothetical protein